MLNRWDYGSQARDHAVEFLRVAKLLVRATDNASKGWLVPGGSFVHDWLASSVDWKS
jgi:hypothetical protein